MDRINWLKEKRRETEANYDTLWAPGYDVEWGIYENASHQQFIQKFLRLLPPYSTILDAACGSGRYMSMLLEKGHTVIGIDQSRGMLARAREKFPTVQLEKVGLQEIAYRAVFDGAICMDAMEHVFPEDWALVLSNFYRALKPAGYLYFTVEIGNPAEIAEAFIEGQQMGLPIIHGEVADGEGYHYYPAMEQVKEWLRQAGFSLVAEGEGNIYHHFVVRKA
jgi:ubiquinone/menaquinone biosynthesis C-methylase UbiE